MALEPFTVGYRQRGRFAGFSLYVSTIGDIQGSALCYKDGPQLPPLNFTTCTGHGRYVIFYNDRLDGVTYPDGYEIQNVFTELCEVIVQGTEFRIIKCATILLANNVTPFFNTTETIVENMVICSRSICHSECYNEVTAA